MRLLSCELTLEIEFGKGKTANLEEVFWAESWATNQIPKRSGFGDVHKSRKENGKWSRLAGKQK